MWDVEHTHTLTYTHLHTHIHKYPSPSTSTRTQSRVWSQLWTGSTRRLSLWPPAATLCTRSPLPTGNPCAMPPMMARAVTRRPRLRVQPLERGGSHVWYQASSTVPSSLQMRFICVPSQSTHPAPVFAPAPALAPASAPAPTPAPTPVLTLTMTFFTFIL